jgi:hypothetical protein
LRRNNENKKRERERSVRDFGIVTIIESRSKMRGGGEHSFIVGRGERTLLDELQVSHIQKK